MEKKFENELKDLYFSYHDKEIEKHQFLARREVLFFESNYPEMPFDKKKTIEKNIKLSISESKVYKEFKKALKDLKVNDRISIDEYKDYKNNLYSSWTVIGFDKKTELEKEVDTEIRVEKNYDYEYETQLNKEEIERLKLRIEEKNKEICELKLEAVKGNRRAELSDENLNIPLSNHLSWYRIDQHLNKLLQGTANATVNTFSTVWNFTNETKEKLASGLRVTYWIIFVLIVLTLINFFWSLNRIISSLGVLFIKKNIEKAPTPIHEGNIPVVQNFHFTELAEAKKLPKRSKK